MFIFGSQNLNNHKFFKKNCIIEKFSNFCVDFIGFHQKIFWWVLQIAYEWYYEQQAKIVIIMFFLCNFNNFISRFDFSGSRIIQNQTIHVERQFISYTDIDTKS